jgi:hypothetical protein
MGDQVALRQDFFDLSAFPLAVGLRIGEALAVLWRAVALDLGLLRVTSTLIRVTGRGLVRTATKSQAGERVLQLPEWCVILLDKRRAVGVSADEPIFRGRATALRLLAVWLSANRDGTQ